MTVTTNRARLVPAGTLRLVTEASQLGLQPGLWPDEVVILDSDKGDPSLPAIFRLRESIHDGDELHGCAYQSRDGRWTLTILND